MLICEATLASVTAQAALWDDLSGASRNTAIAAGSEIITIYPAEFQAAMTPPYEK